MLDTNNKAPIQETSRDTSSDNNDLHEKVGAEDIALLGNSEVSNNKKSAISYVDKGKFGVTDPDAVDEDIADKYADRTPNTQRRLVANDEMKDVKKLGAIQTCFTIFKGFVATGVLYVPADFKNGGYVFTPITLIGSLIVTLYCAKLLLQVNARLGGGSFPEMAMKAYGNPGRIFTEIVLVASQFGFCTAYVYFIASQIGGVGGVIPCLTRDKSLGTEEMPCMGGIEINKWIWMPICMAIYVPLVMVRKIEKFAATHIFADIMIIITIVAIFGYAGKSLSTDGIQITGIGPIESKWADSIGFSVYTYEGIGVVLPIYEVTKDKSQYYKLLCITVSFIAVLYIVFGEFTMLAWGSTPNFDLPLITASLPETDIITYILKILFSFNLFFSYPLVIHPANIVVESWFFKAWPKSKKRQFCKNISRTVIVALSCVVALSVFDKLESFLSITGALTCIPVAFLIPAALHLEVVAKADNDKTAKIIDWSILIFGTIALLYCTTCAILGFND